MPHTHQPVHTHRTCTTSDYLLKRRRAATPDYSHLPRPSCLAAIYVACAPPDALPCAQRVLPVELFSRGAAADPFARPAATVTCDIEDLRAVHRGYAQGGPLTGRRVDGARAPAVPKAESDTIDRMWRQACRSATPPPKVPAEAELFARAQALLPPEIFSSEKKIEALRGRTSLGLSTTLENVVTYQHPRAPAGSDIPTEQIDAAQSRTPLGQSPVDTHLHALMYSMCTCMRRLLLTLLELSIVASVCCARPSQPLLCRSRLRVARRRARSDRGRTVCASAGAASFGDIALFATLYFVMLYVCGTVLWYAPRGTYDRRGAVDCSRPALTLLSHAFLPAYVSRRFRVLRVLCCRKCCPPSSSPLNPLPPRARSMRCYAECRMQSRRRSLPRPTYAGGNRGSSRRGRPPFRLRLSESGRATLRKRRS